jgi:carboxylesterase
LRLGEATYRAARTAPPAARTLMVVTNAADTTVDNRETERLIRHWRGSGYTGLSTYAFDAALGLPHDLIDPAQPDSRVDVVYPVLLQLLERR